MASDGQSVDLPSNIIDLLNDNQYVPESRADFLEVLQDVQAGQSITLPNLGQQPKHFGKGYQGRAFFVTQQMVDMWQTLSTDQQQPCSIKCVLSGPMGVGKSYLALFLAAKAYSENWPVLYIADAGKLDQPTEENSSIEICHRFLSLNKDILTAAELKKLVEHEDRSKPLVVSCAATIFGDILQRTNRKTLLVVDEHGALFDNDPPAPVQLPILKPLMTLTYWGEHIAGARVVLTGITHAKFERKYLKSGMQDWIVFVGPLSEDVFSKLLELHPLLGKLTIAPKVKQITNCIPRELMHLHKRITKSNGTYIRENKINDSLTYFREARRNEFLKQARNYVQTLDHGFFVDYRKALSNMFLRQADIESTVDFDWQFLDTGLVYRFKDKYNYVMFKPLCPAALDALLEVYKTFPLPSDISVASIKSGQLTSDEFEETLFRQLLKYGAKGIAFKATDLNGTKITDVHIQFKHFYFLEKGELAPGSQHAQSLIHGFVHYPRFDFMLGRMFIQLSLSRFDKHNTDSAMIDLAFAPYYANDPRNQIEIYLDTMFGPGHKAEFTQGHFIVTQNGHPVPDFRIVYIRGKPGIPRHHGLVKRYSDVAFINYEEIKTKLFGDFLK
ncbi:9704_t:CDS:1 [Paraglomus occultum]|uniref:9704_t:CDS:1 n=1 Tax=Paraglomus occultum TaxID=144539 RepID=A0A9N8W630_9GLOM|nr:9704_t:CDS:1 [Paraglomus occultum]